MANTEKTANLGLTKSSKVSPDYTLTAGWPKDLDDNLDLIDDAVASAGLIKSATVTLTDEQIKALPTTPVTIIPAPGAGKMILAPVALGDAGGHSVLVVHLVQDYTNLDASLGVEFDLGSNGPYGKYVGPYFSWGSPIDTVFMPSLSTMTGDGVGANDSGSFANVPLTMKVTNGALGDLTGGDPANTLKVTVLYSVLDV